MNPKQNAILQLLIGYALWFIFIIAWNVSDRRPAQTVATAGARRERLYLLVIALGIAMMCVAPLRAVAPPVCCSFWIWVNPPALAWAMVLVVAAGIAFCWWTRLHLGRLWSANVTRKEGHRVVDTGPYRLVRHPIYTGLIVMDLGLAILCATGLALIPVAVSTLGLWLKARLEEQFLAEELGAVAYSGYKARTPMLVPRIARRRETKQSCL